ncbi:lysophospholipid acyltransferase family protein [Candidatus Omnitrophota bacterium]
MFYWFVQITVWILARFYLRLKIEGHENVPKKGPFILASNHRSNLDPPIIAVSMDRKLHFLAKRELFNNELAAKFFRGINLLKLNREGMDKQALRDALDVLKNGRGLLIFPEGTRSKDGKIGFARGGVSAFACSSGAPVIPVFIKGTEQAMPPKKHYILPAKIIVRFGKRIEPPKAISRIDRKSVYQEFTNRVMQEIAGLGKEAA